MTLRFSLNLSLLWGACRCLSGSPGPPRPGSARSSCGGRATTTPRGCLN